VEPSSEQVGTGNILIQTRYNNYTWATVDSGQSLYLTASLINLSDSIYYSHMGDRLAGVDQENIFIGLSVRGGGYIERYNSAEKSWEIINEFHVLIEGSIFIFFRPNIRYMVRGFISPQEKATGKCRIKIEYYDRIDPALDEIPYIDYSNIFFIDD
jgi:hypothetical protein